MNEGTQKNPVLKILHLEDCARDHELIREILEEDGIHCNFSCAQQKDDFNAKLQNETFDLILSDFAMLGYDGLSALEAARTTRPETPFIFVSGTIGEERAVESLKNGATDYVLKQNLRRLAPAILRALREAKGRAEHHRAEIALRESQERLMLATHAANVGLWEWDFRTDRVYFSPQWKAQLGYADQELTNEFATWECRLHPEDHARALATLRSFAANPRETLDFEYRLRHRDGSYRWILTRGRVFNNPQDQPVRTLGCNLDITDRKQSEERIRESEQLYHSLVETIPQSIFRKDLHGRFTFANQRFCDLLGKSASQILGKTDADLFSQQLAAGYQQDDKSIIATGKPFEAVEEIEGSTGQKLYVQTIKTPLRAADGQIVGIQAIIWDITEKRNLEAQSLRSQRMESLGTLAGGVAHDLNNVLAPILMSIEVLRLKYSDRDAERILATIESSATRGAEMVKQVLTFARGVQGERAQLQVGHLIREISRIIKQTFPKGIEVRTIVPSHLHSILGDATQLHQVLLNLCVNARDAMLDGGTLTLEASNFLIDGHFASMNPDAKPGPHILLSVKDSGTGIPAHVLERMFEPFFTTKTLETGTGLGLSTVRGIVKSHAGFIKVYTEIGKGSEFRVFLPAQKSALPTEEQNRPEALTAGNGETVLVVDDEASILNIAKQSLEMFGYQVLTASDGAIAIGLCMQHSAKIKLMLTDMMMPVLDGPATIKAVRHIAPDIKIIAATGFGMENEARESQGLKIDAFLQKPFTAEHLLKTVHRLLNEGQRPTPNIL